MQGEFWLLRQCPSVSEPCDEELYVSGHVVVWSRGSSDAAGAVQVLRCFTTDTPVLEVSILSTNNNNNNNNNTEIYNAHM